MSDPSAIAVRLSSVRLDRGGRSILHRLDLAIPQGSMTAVLGPSGTGKSTLLAAITGELVPAAGRVEVFGKEVPRQPRALLDMRKGLGVLLQGNGLLTDLSVAENVALPLRAHARLPEPVLQRLVEMKLDAVGLRAAANLFPRELSGGMARRAALARALALDPPLLLCDEPLTGELPAAAGTVEVFGQPIPHGARALLAMRKGLGVLLQGNGLLTDLTVAENVALPLRTHTKLPEPVLQALVRMKLHAVGLLAAAEAWPRELSGGMARRVALARALALDPPLMLYDEPLTGLDPIASGVIMSLIQRLNDTLGLTSIIVSHHVHETLPIADQALVIANGSLVFSGTPAQLQASTDPLVGQFLRGEPDGPIAFDTVKRGEAA